MRATAWFVAAIGGTLVLAALLAFPIWQFVHAIQPDWPFHRVLGRSWQLLLLIGLVLAVRRLGLRSREDWGYGLPRSHFMRQVLAGLAIGLATMLPMSLAMLALGIRTLEPDVDAAMLPAAIGMGALTGLAVALVEETFFRGLMFRAVFRESGLAVAALATALLYSAIHFLARVRLPQDEISWDSGLALLGVAFSRFADPASIVDSFITLALVGLLLALVRHRTGSIAAGIGLHMGWVCVIKATTGVTADNADGNWSFLVSSFDGYTGWLVAAWAAILIAVAWAGGRLRPVRAAP
jgi:membrane protease YdiL (CAAX protease family)